MTDWLRALAPYHDYGWFIALLAWVAAASIGRHTLRGLPGWGWLPWAAWPGAIAAAMELVSFAWSLPAMGGVPGALVEDVFLGFLVAITVAGWIGGLPIPRALRVGGSILVLVAAALRVEMPAGGAIAIATIGVIAALAHAMRRETPRAAAVSLLLAAAALWLTSAGPLASLGFQPRRSVNLGEWSPVWSAVQAGVALVTVAGVLAPWFADGERRREWRPFLAACGLWLIVGLGLATASSAWARRNFEEQAVARTRAAAALMDKAALKQLLGADFQLTDFFSIPRTNGPPLWVAHVAQLRSLAGIKVQHELGLVELADPEKGWALVQTPRGGWLARITSERYPTSRNRRDVVSLSRPSEDDWLDWSAKRASFLPLLQEWTSRANTIADARAPLVAEDGRILGWLMLDFPREQWIAAQAQPRLLTYLIVGLGLGLATLFTLQRMQAREHEATRASAIAAAQADKLKTAFLAKVSHELRTPIQSVLGYGELLQNTATNPLARKRLAALREHGELMLRLVNDLLDLSAIHADAFRLVPKPTALTELAQQTVESLRPRAEAKGLALFVTVTDQVPLWAEIDRERVRQVILNLVGNAVKFTDRGVVDVALEPGAQPGEVMLTVRDTGPGIPAGGVEKLFQPFERLDGTVEKEGTGLGLALTAGICRSMHGGVSAESSLGAGATFRAWFRAPLCAAPAGLNQSSSALGRLAGWRVLVAEDNALVRELFVSALQEAGAVCSTAQDGEQALAVVAKASFDAIVLDLSMPRLGGMEVARRLRADRHAARIVGVSAHAGEREKHQAVAAGMDAFLVKPVRMDALLSAIVANSAGNAGSSDSMAKLIEQLSKEFRGLAADEGAALAAAVSSGDFEEAYGRAHHLMNSAAVVRDDLLFEACMRAEQAAQTHDTVALQTAWHDCEAALKPWIAPSAGNSESPFSVRKKQP